MHKEFKSAIAKILMISLIFTQSSMMPAAYVMADSIEKTTQNAKRATSSEMDEVNQIASDSDLDGELLENDLEPLPDGEMLENIDTATLSNAYALNRSLGSWDGSSEVEITPIGNTYYVTNPAELAWVSRVTNDGQESFEGKIVSILDDLDLGGHEWPGIGTSKNPFCGSFEGNNHSISGLVNEDSDCVGLFGSITANDDIYLRNLILDAAECSGIAKLDGLLVGQIHINDKTKVTIFNMDISGELNIVRGGGGIVNVWNTGGVVGKVTSGDGASLEINKVEVSGDIHVSCARNWESSLCGGLVGYSELSGIMEIVDSSFSGNIETEAGEGTAVGGLVGQTMNATLRFRLVHVEGSLKGTGSSATNVGGFIGDASCPTLDIQDSYVTADVISGSSGNSAPGGLIGCLNCQLDYAESFIKNCHISGGVFGRNSAVYIANNGSETETVSVENCYYDKSKPGLDTEHVITCLVALRTITLECSDIQGLTAEESVMESSYLDWDFMNVWTLEEGDYPKLRENVVLNKGLLVGMDSEVLIYYLPEERYETESFDLNYEYCIDETEILEGDIQTEDVLAQIKIRLPQGFSFSPDEAVTESFVSDSRAPEGYVYVNLGEQGRGSIRVYTTKDLEKAESFRFRISINATGFEAYSSYSDMSVAMKNEQPSYVPEDAVYNPENGHYYKVFDQSSYMSWYEAKEHCEKLKGHLVTITSRQEQYFVNKLVKESKKKNMWIGAELVWDEWHWIMPESWEYTNWDDGEPDCANGESAAVTIYTYSGINEDGKEVEIGIWKDAMKTALDQEERPISDIGFVCEWDVKELEDQDNIINIVKKYTSGEMSEALEKIMNEGGSIESRGEKLNRLFVQNGISDPLYGIQYLKDTYDERWAYNALISNDMYLAYQYKMYLHTTVKGNIARASLAASGLVFNNELDEWLSLDTVTGETPGVSRYKEMLQSFIQLSSSDVEWLNYSKKILSFIDRIKGYLDKKDVAEVENLLNWGSKYDLNDELMERLVNLFDKVDKLNYNKEKGTFSCTLKDTQLSEALKLSKDFFTLSGIATDEFCGYMNLSAKISTYRQYEDFLIEIKNAKELPKEMRIAAHLILQDLRQGYFLPLLDALKGVGDWSIGKLDFTKLKIKDLAYLKMEAYAVNTWLNVGNLTEKSKYTEGYGFLGEYFTEKLKNDKEKFLENPNEKNAYEFFNDYILLYQVRREGEKAYRDMCDMKGTYYDLYKDIFREARYQTKMDVAEGHISFLEEKCKINVSSEFIESDDEIKYAKKVVIDCPVDVIIFDQKGNQICYLSDGTEMDLSNEYGRFAVWYDPYSQEYGKSICLFDENNVQIEIAGIGTGIMSIQVADQKGDIYKICNHSIGVDEMYTLYLEDIPICVRKNRGESDVEKIPMTYDNMEYVAVSDVIVDPDLITCHKGEEFAPIIKVLPENASNQNLFWFSKDEDIATINNGKISALNQGQTEITVISRDGFISKTFRVIVKEKENSKDDVTDESEKKPEGNEDKEPEKKPEGSEEEDPEKEPEGGEEDNPESKPGGNISANRPGFGNSSGGGSGSSSKVSVTQTIIPETPGKWIQDERGWLYFGLEGLPYNNTWIYVKGFWYRIGTENYMLEGWNLINNIWYYMAPVTGEMKIGWLLDQGIWYYLDNSGAMRIGWIQINGFWYYLDKNGRLLVNTVTPDGYQVDDQGRWVY